MAQTYTSRRLRIQRDAERRLDRDMRTMALDVYALIRHAATDRNDRGEPVIPDTLAAKSNLSNRVWEVVVRPYFVGAGNDPLIGPTPQSPYTRLVVDAIRETTTLAVAENDAVARRLASPTVYAFLTGARPLAGMVREIRGVYDPYYAWLDPNGYRLSDRVWQSSVQVRANINRLLAYHIDQGTAAVNMARELEQYLVPSQATVVTSRPYGRNGSYPARRLARTEITAAAGRGTIDAALANPFVDSIRWRLSASHPRRDICDDLATGGADGDGVYPKDNVPTYPPHPHCLCSLLPVAAAQPAAINRRIESGIAQRTPRVMRLAGVLNIEWLTQAILVGFLDEALAGV